MTTLEQIKAWWSGSRVPTVIQRQETFDSFRHKDDKVAIGDVTDLSSAMNAKADLGEDGKVLPEQLPDTSSLGNWYVDEVGNLQNVIDEAGIGMANWSIDANGYFTGTAGAANLLKRSPLEFVNKWYLDENDNLVFTEWDGEAYVDRGALEWNKLNDITYKNWEGYIVDKDGNALNANYANNAAWASGASNSDAANTIANIWYDDGDNLTSGNYYNGGQIRGISTPNWFISNEGYFNGTSEYSHNANIANLLGGFWDGSSNVGELRAGAAGDYPNPQPASIVTQNWSIYNDGIADFNYLRLYDGANGVWTDILAQDSGYIFYDAGQWSCFSFQGDNFRFGDAGSGGSWGANKPLGMSIGDSTYCYFPFAGDEVLAVSVQGNFADQYGNIRKVLRSLTTSEINALTGQDADTGVMYYNTTLDCPVFKSAAGWRKFSHTAM